MSDGVDSKRVLFNNGEPVVFTDFNDIGKSAQQMSWEVPGYADLLPFAPLTPGDNGYSDQFSLAKDDVTKCAYVKGGAAAPSFDAASFDVNFSAGFLGAYYGASSPVAVDPKMYWIYLPGETTVTVAGTAPGLKRIDMLTVRFAEVASDSISRDFRDAVTGALSTSSPNKRTSIQATLTLRVGTPDAAPGPTEIAGLPLDERIVALIHVTENGVELVRDLTMPFGPAQQQLVRPASNFHSNSNWTSVPGGGILSGADGHDVIIYPTMYLGDPTAKLIGFEMEYDFPTTLPPVKLVRFRFGLTLFSTVVLEDITGRFSTGANVTRVDLRGCKVFDSGSNLGPIWGHGRHYKSGGVIQDEGASPVLDYRYGVGIQITSTATFPEYVMWVNWLWAKG